jgi:hypothetical protein
MGEPQSAQEATCEPGRRYRFVLLAGLVAALDADDAPEAAFFDGCDWRGKVAGRALTVVGAGVCVKRPGAEGGRAEPFPLPGLPAARDGTDEEAWEELAERGRMLLLPKSGTEACVDHDGGGPLPLSDRLKSPAAPPTSQCICSGGLRAETWPLAVGSGRYAVNRPLMSAGPEKAQSTGLSPTVCASPRLPFRS